MSCGLGVSLTAGAVKLASAQAMRDSQQYMSETNLDSNGVAAANNGPRDHYLPYIPNFEKNSPLLGADAGKMADLMNIPIESIVSAFEATQPAGDQKQSSQPRFRISNWMAQHYKHVQHIKNLEPIQGQDVSNNFSLVVSVKNDNASKKKRKKCARLILGLRWRSTGFPGGIRWGFAQWPC